MSFLFRRNVVNHIIPKLPSDYYVWYDAIDNTADGHSFSTTTWYDKAGHIDLYLNGSLSSSCGEWFSNHYYNNTSDGVFTGCFLSRENYEALNLQTGDCTLILLEVPEYVADSYYVFGECNRGGTGYYRFNIKCCSAEGYVGLSQHNSQSWVTPVRYEPVEYLGENMLICITRSGTNLKLYLNGQLKDENNSYTLPLTSVPNSYTILGGRHAKVYTALAYKRTLSSHEIVNIARWAADRYNLVLKAL